MAAPGSDDDLPFLSDRGCPSCDRTAIVLVETRMDDWIVECVSCGRRLRLRRVSRAG